MPDWPTVMVTGHRPQHLAPEAQGWVRSELDRLALKLQAEYGMNTGISGMALGADLWWADTVTRAGAWLWAHVPFPQQPDRWQPADRVEWQRLLGLAARTTTYGANFDVKLLHARNAGMIKVADAAVAVWDPGKRSGGTASAVKLLTARGVPVIHVNPATQTTTLRRARTGPTSTVTPEPPLPGGAGTPRTSAAA